MTTSLAISIVESHFLDYPTKARTGKLKVGGKFKKTKGKNSFRNSCLRDFNPV